MVGDRTESKSSVMLQYADYSRNTEAYSQRFRRHVENLKTPPSTLGHKDRDYKKEEIGIERERYTRRQAGEGVVAFEGGDEE